MSHCNGFYNKIQPKSFLENGVGDPVLPLPSEKIEKRNPDMKVYCQICGYLWSQHLAFS